MGDRGLARDIKVFFLGVAIGMLLFFATTRAIQLSGIELLGLLATAVALVLGVLANLDARETKQLINEVRVQLAGMDANILALQYAFLLGASGSYQIPARTSP
jgi:hypothetical protein